ncbi:aldehyde dehydrogenase family protein [Mycobacterium sp. CVI_P3]|uniref:Aldehyde dehydrogenase family protein n=1 Tax=Mycobacterium pinniadriaticum TaxID=2994102 RepID=A0ABT3SGX6_9MYCO|nr:aldehyde dehydrogenase family protein [Mycobacterium pinniadriaticum]MCX2931770.1 aldehyde dehydrogenase family protein [Mycobacterium pinniadriaticum]MCX2938155.1 aldehyde dehydrogenase family protein [Mycobacterium pinniadriaticum]
MYEFKGQYISGDWTSPGGDLGEVINPATEEVIGTAAIGSVADAEAAVGAARTAFDEGPWPRMSPQKRCDIMARFYDILTGQQDTLEHLIVAEAGATYPLAKFAHIGIAMDHFRFALDEARTRRPVTPLPPTVSQGVGGPGSLGSAVTVREPIGVVSAITAFNYPHLINLGKIVPALLMGNTVVLKPSPYTPLQALTLADIATEAGVPAGALNIVTGGVDVGRVLTSDGRVDMVSFTGSPSVGVSVMEQGAPTIKKVLLELGGKSALIARADIDVDRVAEQAAMGLTYQAGQGCGLCSRFLVHNSILPSFVEKAAAVLSSIRIGDPADPATQMGPLIREVQRERVASMVDAAVRHGAVAVTGGRIPEHLSKGFFYEPTLLTNVDNGATIAQEEVFGPVGVVIGFDTDDEAIAIANDSRYGLSGAIWSADSARAFEMALQIRTGTVKINGGSAVEAPFGGYKWSGIGREYGTEGLDEYTETKAISYRA